MVSLPRSNNASPNFDFGYFLESYHGKRTKSSQRADPEHSVNFLGG